MNRKISVYPETPLEERDAGDVCIEGEEGFVRLTLRLKPLRFPLYEDASGLQAEDFSVISKNWIAAERNLFWPEPK